jgi:hypothetical protein
MKTESIICHCIIRVKKEVVIALLSTHMHSQILCPPVFYEKWVPSTDLIVEYLSYRYLFLY